MEENIFEMEYVINGEKYLITATKVDENVETTITKNVCEEKLDDSYEFKNTVLTFNVNDIPDGMDINTWLSIVGKYGIILIK